jgi:hypothetical protein
VPVIDINTSDLTVDGAAPGQAFQPTRYTNRRADDIRVGVWEILSTVKGTYRLDLNQGLDVEEIMNPATSDAERSALVAEIVLGFPGVTGIITGPTVTFDDDLLEWQIDVTANTVDGAISVTA